MAGKGRAPCCEKNNVKKGPWSPAEDLRLTAFIQKNGHGNWRSLPKLAGLARCGKSCRLRWINYLSPNVKRGNFTLEEEETIIKLHNSYGNRWSKIAAQLPGRTDNEIKNVWNTHLKKRLIKKDSECHKDDKLSKGTSIIPPSSPSSSSTSNVSCGDLNVEKGLNDQDYLTKMPDPSTEISTTKSCQNNKPKGTSRSSSFSSNVSNASSSNQVDVARPSDEMESIFNYEGLGEVHNAANEIGNELFLDSEFDIWNVLENLESFEVPQEQLVDYMPSSNSRKKHEIENEQNEWLRYLENYELGLKGIIEEDQSKAAENNYEEMSTCFPLWPPSPHNFDI